MCSCLCSDLSGFRSWPVLLDLPPARIPWVEKPASFLDPLSWCQFPIRDYYWALILLQLKKSYLFSQCEYLSLLYTSSAERYFVACTLSEDGHSSIVNISSCNFSTVILLASLHTSKQISWHLLETFRQI